MSVLKLIQLILFIIGSIFILCVSRKSLKTLKAHGFYRFFVFESILFLIILNFPVWYIDAFSIRQIASWVCLLISLYLVYQSFRTLKRIGGSNKRQSISANFEFENTVNLVKDGVYKYIRHPMYSSLLFLCFGAFLKNVDLYTVLLTAVACIFLVLTAKVEENENIQFFGDSYYKYIKETKMFIPFIL